MYDWSLVEQKAHRKLWADALLSKKYPIVIQDHLKTDKGYSVLGILELLSGGSFYDDEFFTFDPVQGRHSKKHIKGTWKYEWRATRSESPTAVSLAAMRWVGMKSSTGVLRLPGVPVTDLTNISKSVVKKSAAITKVAKLILSGTPGMFDSFVQERSQELIDQEEDELEDA